MEEQNKISNDFKSKSTEKKFPFIYPLFKIDENIISINFKMMARLKKYVRDKIHIFIRNKYPKQHNNIEELGNEYINLSLAVSRYLNKLEYAIMEVFDNQIYNNKNKDFKILEDIEKCRGKSIKWVQKEKKYFKNYLRKKYETSVNKESLGLNNDLINKFKDEKIIENLSNQIAQKLKNRNDFNSKQKIAKKIDNNITMNRSESNINKDVPNKSSKRGRPKGSNNPDIQKRNEWIVKTHDELESKGYLGSEKWDKLKSKLKIKYKKLGHIKIGTIKNIYDKNK